MTTPSNQVPPIPSAEDYLAKVIFGLVTMTANDDPVSKAVAQQIATEYVNALTGGGNDDNNE